MYRIMIALCAALFLASINFPLTLISAANAKTLEIGILRTHESSSCTTGELYVNGDFIAHTLELPWRNNRSFVSSIPAKRYGAFLRYDKNDRWRLQLKNVPGRSGVQIHIGNWPSEIQGCVLVGRKVANSRCALGDSADAYRALKDAFYGFANPISSPNVDVTVNVQYFPRETQFVDGETVYQKAGTNWRVSGREFVYKEQLRTMKYIYLKPEGGPFEDRIVRWGLHGGAFQLKHDTQNRWREFELNLRRRY